MDKTLYLVSQQTPPCGDGEKEISEFLTHLAVKKRVASSTQNQALSAILFLYKEVLGREVGDLCNVTWAKRSKKIPEVLTQDEVRQVLAQLTGVKWTWHQEAHE